MTVLRERATWVWLGLMLLTGWTTWGFSKEAFSPATAAVGMFVIAAVKVRYVMLDFMELREAPLAMRLAGAAWTVGVAGMVLVFWFATPAARM